MTTIGSQWPGAGRSGISWSPPTVRSSPDQLSRRSTIAEDDLRWGQLIVLDLLLGLSLIFLSYPVRPSLPGGIVTAAAMIAVGVCRRPTRRVAWGGTMLLGVAATFVYLAVVSAHEHVPWTQRMAKFVLLALAAAVVAVGRVDLRSLIVGGCLGAAVNVPCFYLGLTSNNYPPHLSGFYGDKNVAGMYYALWGMLGLAVLRRPRAQLAWVAFSLVALFLTGSRTAISAALLALIWVALRNRVNLPVRVALSAGGVLLLRYVEARFSRVSVYSDRGGTDWYRHQIDLATQAKVNLTPWTGEGLNQGFVVLGGIRRAWFHDSYAQAFVEGGYVFLGATLIAFGLLGLGLLSRRRQASRPLLMAEAGCVVVMVCAWKLGETFMTIGAFMALAIAVSYRFGEPLSYDPQRRWAPR